MNSSNRIASIDILRALTMFLMIFVNDLWTLHNIPGWLEHAKASEDALGFADVIFPAFLFIVGLSIPFATIARKNKSQSKGRIFGHISTRTIALVVMGFFMVNYENINKELVPFNRFFWEILMALAFVLIWNAYQKKKVFKTVPVKILQGIGITILIFLAIVYNGGDIGAPSWMRPHWWGILGLIGWAYLICATIYLIGNGRIYLMGAMVVIFYILNMQEFYPLAGMSPVRIIVGASNHALVMSGVFASTLYIYMKEKGKLNNFLIFLLIFGIISLVFGFATRPLWGISKIRATPSWTGICAGITAISFGILIIIADNLGRTKWARIFGPAGRSTLTCYLVPYFYYPIMALIGIRLPEILRGGFVGIIKSLLFALLIIGITGILEKLKIRLRI